MRSAAILISASAMLVALAPVSAAAKDDPAKPSGASEVAAKLNDPLTQYAVAGMISAMSKALLEMPVEPLVQALEQASGKRPDALPKDARVADVAGLDQEKVRGEIVDHVPRAMAAMGALAGAAEAMTPQLKAMARKMQESMPKP